MSGSATPPTLRTARRALAWILIGLILCAGFVAVWIGVRGFAAYGHLREAEAAATALRDDLDDPAQVEESLTSIARDTAAARALTTDPLWQLTEGLPWAGSQLSAVSAVAASLDDVAATALEPLVEAASTFRFDAIRPSDGQFDVGAIAALHESAHEAAAGIERAAEEIDGIERSRLLPPVRAAIDDVAALMRQTHEAVAALSRTSALLPPMLGGDSPREYLVLVQNNAEWRSLGGNPGAVALIRADGGRLSLTSQASASDFPSFDTSVVPLSGEVEAIYTQRPGRWMQNVTQVPEFAVSGALAREMWARQHGHYVDGVVAVDPVALSYILEATGPVALPTGDVLAADNAVSLLLNEVYLRYQQPAEQDAFFAEAAAAVFEVLAAGRADPAALVTALMRAADERRLLLWSSHESDQALLEETTLAGGLPVTDDSTARFGVYLNDGTGSKMDYYMTAKLAVACGGNGDSEPSAGDAELQLTLENGAPASATSLPHYVTGGGQYGLPPGTVRTVTYVYLPEGYELVDATVSGNLGFGGSTHEGRRVVSFTVDLAPGESAVAKVAARSPDGSTPRLEAVATPTTDSTGPVAAICGGA